MAQLGGGVGPRSCGVGRAAALGAERRDHGEVAGREAADLAHHARLLRVLLALRSRASCLEPAAQTTRVNPSPYVIS